MNANHLRDNVYARKNVNRAAIFRATSSDRSSRERHERVSSEPPRTFLVDSTSDGGFPSFCASTRNERGEEGEKEEEDRPWLPPPPHKYGFSRTVYDQKRVEPREQSRA